MATKTSLLLLTLQPQDAELAVALLMGLGVNTWEEKRKGPLLEWTLALPDRKGPDITRKLKETQQKQGLKVFRSFRVRFLQDQSWQHAYEKYLKPFEMPQPDSIRTWPPILIDPQNHPSGTESPTRLRIKAGLAFGTGTHPSTQLACLHLQEHLYHHATPNLLDMGTGTGVLAMVAKVRGVRDIWAIESDPEASLVAKENFKANKIKGIQLVSKLKPVRKKFSLIIANMLLSQILENLDTLKAKLRSKGHMIFSGLTYRDISYLEAHLKEFQPLGRINQKGWASLYYKKGAAN